MLELTTYTELEIAHRLGGAYSGRCLHWHGHRYEVEITVTAQKLNEDGMIVDFKKLKEVVKTVLDDKWDHGACVRADDPLARTLMEDAHHERVHIIDANPTLEWMVDHWAHELQEALDNECPGVAVSMLKASETARNTVTWRCSCLPWERSEPVADAKDTLPIIKRTTSYNFALACAKDALETYSGSKVEIAPIDEPFYKFAVTISRKPTCAEKDACASPAEAEEANPDAVPYLVTYTNGNTIGSRVIYSSAKAQALYDYCTQQVQPPDSLFVMSVISISRLPA